MYSSQVKQEHSDLKYYGLDLIEGGQWDGVGNSDIWSRFSINNCNLEIYHSADLVREPVQKILTPSLRNLPGLVRDNKGAGVFEPALSKLKQLKFATEAAITILRIDDMIKLEPEQKEQSGYQQALQSGQLG